VDLIRLSSESIRGWHFTKRFNMGLVVPSDWSGSRLNRRPYYEAGRRRLTNKLNCWRDRSPSWRLALQPARHFNRWRAAGELDHGHPWRGAFDLAITADQEGVMPGSDPDLLAGAIARNPTFTKRGRPPPGGRPLTCGYPPYSCGTGTARHLVRYPRARQRLIDLRIAQGTVGPLR
jgi:hypothetical protein